MYKKRALVLGGYLSLLALAACGPKVIDDSDLVSIDYEYTFNWAVIDQWSADFTVWDAGELAWIEDIVRWAKQDAEFTWTVNWWQIYKHDNNKVLSFQNVHLTEIMWIENPQIWTEVDVNSVWHGIITSIEKGSDWYDSYIVEFNDPKTYSEISYLIKVTNIEKK